MDGWVSTESGFWERGTKSERDGNRYGEDGESGKRMVGRRGKGDKWREAAGRKMEQQTEGQMKRRK